jgi:hypothetical protein
LAASDWLPEFIFICLYPFLCGSLPEALPTLAQRIQRTPLSH